MNRIIRNILIIDPLATSKVLDKGFSKHGLSTLSAESTSDALELIIEKKPDFVLLTISTYGEIGLESLKEILRTDPTIKVIIVSELPDDSFALEYMREGAADYLKGPIVIDALICSITRIQNKINCLSIFSEPDIACVVCEDKTLVLDNNLDRIPYVVNQAVLNAGKVCPDIDLLKMALGEIIINAVEHGNLNISMKEKFEAVNNGTYRELFEQRNHDPHYASRVVIIQVHMERDALTYHVIDEGEGFDYRKEFDPDPENHIGSGLGMQIARNFFSDVFYEGQGNMVKLVYNRR
jgi:ActR/RegA family two-component response regulator